MKPRDDHISFHPSAEWKAEFERQLTLPMLNRLKAYAARRLAGFGSGAPVDMDYAEDLAASAAHDTVCGRVTWNPERRKLEQHLKNVIKRRLWLDWKHAKRFRVESIDASDDDDRSTTFDDMELALAERCPDPEATENAISALRELEQLAIYDPELAVYIDARADDLTGGDLEASTGLAPEGVRRVRRRLDVIEKQLPYQVRPMPRKRGK